MTDCGRNHRPPTSNGPQPIELSSHGHSHGLDKRAFGLDRLIRAVGRASRATPAIRGKNRLYLALLRALGAESRRTIVVVPLTNPVEYRAELDLRSWLQRFAFVAGSYEPKTVEFLARLVRAHPRRGAIMDIGANIGLISIPLAILLRRLGKPDSEFVIYAFEPVKDNFTQLKRNIALNELGPAFRLFNVALGDEQKVVDMHVEGNLAPGEGSGAATVLPEASTYDCMRTPVTLSLLDEMVREGEVDANISVIKIDTDGYDLKILKGARDLLIKSRPVVFGEFHTQCLDWHQQSITSVREYAKEIDYEVFTKIPSAYRFTREADDNNFLQDLLLVPQEYVSHNSWCLS